MEITQYKKIYIYILAVNNFLCWDIENQLGLLQGKVLTKNCPRFVPTKTSAEKDSQGQISVGAHEKHAKK